MPEKIQRALDGKVDPTVWGLFFVWIGIAVLAHLGWGIGLVGVGVITLGAQAWRGYLGLRVDRFSLVVGSLFTIGGIWSLLDLRIDLVPVLCIVAGIALLVSTLAGRTHDPRSGKGGKRPTTPAHPPA